MRIHMQKRWRLKFRRDPDAGRVLFLGPLVVSLDVVRRRPSVYANVGHGSGFPPTTSTASTDAQRRREKERLMGGIL